VSNLASTRATFTNISLSVHAMKNSEGISRLIGPNLEDCFYTWECARATAAAFPYFAPYPWRDRKLLDGGFKVNCPAETGYHEAKYVWSNRSMDTIISLGTGSYEGGPTRPRKNLALKVGRQVVDAITNSTQLWEEFKSRVGREES
jgi:hypothetical protein